MISRLLDHILRPAPRPTSDAPGDRIRFLGTAGFVLRGGGRTFVLDPFLTRPSLLGTLTTPLIPNEALLAREIPHCDDVLVGHSHHDHAMDAPAVARLTGARLIGSESTLNIARAYGLPETQLHLADGPVQCGPCRATPIPSLHGKAILGRVPLPGDIPVPPEWPPRVWDFRHGPVHLWHVDLGDARVLHVDSADYLDEHLESIRCDILCLCAAGRRYRRDYTRRIVSLVRPSVVIPCHWDDYSTPWGAPARQLPGVDVEGFADEIRAAGARALVLGLGQGWSW